MFDKAKGFGAEWFWRVVVRKDSNSFDHGLKLMRLAIVLAFNFLVSFLSVLIMLVVFFNPITALCFQNINTRASRFHYKKKKVT